MDSAIFATSCTRQGQHQKFSAMGYSRLKRKIKKDRGRAARRRKDLKVQNFQPVMKAVDVEKLKEEFETKPSKKD